MSHEPARKDKRRTRTQRGRINLTQCRYSVENFCVVQPVHEVNRWQRQKAQAICGYPPYSQLSGLPAWPCLRIRFQGDRGLLRRTQASETPCPKTKDPSGGTTGRVKPYWRLGWMGARADTASMGRDYRSHRHCVARGTADVQTFFDFLTTRAGIFQRKFNALRGGRFRQVRPPW